MARILIVDDHPLIRIGIRALLEEPPARHEVGEATTGTEALDMLRGDGWQAVVLDLSLPDRAGLELLRMVREQFPGIPVLVCSAHSEIDYALRALRAGASAYVAKDAAADQIVLAVGRALEGKRYIPPALAERLAEEMVDGAPVAALHDRLSDRELDVLRLIAAGRRNTEIAGTLFISIKTVSTHRTNILRKLGLQNNSELIRYALRHGLAG